MTFCAWLMQLKSTFFHIKEVTFWWDHECVGENYSNQFIFRNFPTEFPSSHADCLTGDQAPCLRSRAGE